MKNTLVYALAMVISAYLVGDMLRKAKDFDRTVRVKGLSEKEVEANYAIWPMTLSKGDNDIEKLSRDIEIQKIQVLDFFKDLGFEESEISLGVPGLEDVELNNYNANHSKSRYSAFLEITIRTQAMKKIKKALTASQQLYGKGIILNSKNKWQPIQYHYTKLNVIKPQMVEEATKRAKEVAEKFALDSDSKVGKIKSANQGLFTITDRDSSSPEIKRVRIVSTIEYYLED